MISAVSCLPEKQGARVLLHHFLVYLYDCSTQVKALWVDKSVLVTFKCRALRTTLLLFTCSPSTGICLTQDVQLRKRHSQSRKAITLFLLIARIEPVGSSAGCGLRKKCHLCLKMCFGPRTVLAVKISADKKTHQALGTVGVEVTAPRWQRDFLVKVRLKAADTLPLVRLNDPYLKASCDCVLYLPHPLHLHLHLISTICHLTNIYWFMTWMWGAIIFYLDFARVVIKILLAWVSLSEFEIQNSSGWIIYVGLFMGNLFDYFQSWAAMMYEITLSINWQIHFKSIKSIRG